MIVIVHAIIGTSLFICMCAYIYYANKGNNTTLYYTKYYEFLTFKEKIFIISSAIAFIICMYKGSEFMLSWIPKYVGMPNEDGTKTPLSSNLAAIFAFIGGFHLLGFIDVANHNIFTLKYYFEKDNIISKINRNSYSINGLTELKKEFEVEKIKIDNEIKIKHGTICYVTLLSFEHKRLMLYSEYIDIINEKIENMNKTTDISSNI